MPERTKKEVEKMVAEFLGMIGEERFDIELHSKKLKSKNINSYFWVLCAKISQNSMDGAKPTKEDVYRDIVKHVGVFNDKPVLVEEVDDRTVAWERQGIGFFTEFLDQIQRDVRYEWKGKEYSRKYYMIRHYYGSSTYTQEQMSFLVDEVIFRAEELGIDTITPDEKAKMLELWGAKEGNKIG